MASGKEELKGTGSVDRHEKTHDVPFAKGGNTKMFGRQGADPATAAQTSVTPGGDQEKFAKGGSGKMFGFTGALPARDGITSAR